MVGAPKNGDFPSDMMLIFIKLINVIVKETTTLGHINLNS